MKRSLATALSLSVLALTACGTTSELNIDPAAASTERAPAPAAAPADAPVPAPSTVSQPAAPGSEPEPEPDPATPPAADDQGDTPVSEGPECSATPVTAVDQALPDAVDAARRAVSDAAGRCDDQLLHTAATESSQFTYSFGEQGDFVGHLWRLESEGEPVFRYLAELLQTTPALADGGTAYVWPRVLTGRPEDTTDDAWAELVPIFGEAGVEELRASGAGGYLGWRVGIAPDGELRFFVNGD